MLRDVFYYGKKPNVHPREQHATNLVDARRKSTTEHFWIINEFCDYTDFDWDFDFEFLPDNEVWAQEHNNVWPSYHQKDSGTWLCAKKYSEVIVYRNDVDPLKRKNRNTGNWKILENIDVSKWDFTWHPDPTDPPFIYKWGSKYAPVELKTCIEYHVEGATAIKYMSAIVELLPNWENIVEVQKVDQNHWDMSWRPDPLDPPFIYVWGNKYIDGRLRSTLEYHVPGATEKKYMPELVPVLPEWDRWELIHEVDKTSFDFCWRPDPREPDFIYLFGNTQYDSTVMPTIKYKMPNATVEKHIDTMRAKLSSHPERFQHLEKADGIDYSWVPDPTAPPYIYAWGNQWNKPEDKISIQYVVEGATEYKYMTEVAKRKPCMDNWEIPQNLDTYGFDFSWEPSPADPPYIYEFGTQWQKTGGPRYVVPGATEVKYIDFQKARALPTTKNWTIPNNLDITGFDFSWHPDSTSPPYVYHFATQWALTGGPIYTCEGAKETKYLEEPSAIALPDKTNWEYDPTIIDEDSFDFSWHPYIEDQPYVYQFGTQYQKTGGPRYVTPGAIPTSPTKFIDTRIIKAKRLPNKKNFAILNNYKIKDFDWSWHPDETDEPYIYVFGNTQYPAEIMPTIEYAIPSATQIKYVNDIVATLDADKTNWVITQPINESKFDFSWKPNPKDPPYIYRWGNKYISRKYKSTIDYVVPNATDIKYMDDNVEVLPEWDNWVIPENVDSTGFDFSWRPDPLEPDLIWQFGTQWQKTGGPRYVVPGATEVKYIATQTVKALPKLDKWELPSNIDVTDFDFSWHPDSTSPPYVYHFATQWALSGGPIYRVEGATEVKYLEEPCARALPNRENWEVPNDIDTASFDFSWHPYVEDQPYIYQFGTQHQKTGGPRYITPGIVSTSPIKYIDTRILQAKKLPNKKNFAILNNYKIKDFDWSWHPDETDEPYIYVFGNNQYSAEIMPTIEYAVPGASQIKYVSDIVATLDVDMTNWIVPNNVDTTGFDFSWKPNPKDPAYIYEFGTQWQKTGGPRYVVPGATEVKYVTTQQVKALVDMTNWTIPPHVDVTSFDFSWHPDNTSPPYVYHFATQWALSGGPVYTVPGATENKYIEEPSAIALTNKDNWEIPDDIDESSFDFSWHPYIEDQPYIYQFGTQHQKTGGPKYITPGVVPTSPTKYIDTRILKAKKLPTRKNFAILNNYKIKEFDFSWHPDETEEPYIYVFGNNLYSAEVMPTVEYAMPGAKQIKYIQDIIAILDVDMTNWEVPKNLDTTEFDFSWKPNPKDPAYIYEFGTQWQKTGGPRYIVEGATQVKYVEGSKAKSLPNKENWILPKDIPIVEFDYSWHPDATEDAYIYVFGTQWQLTAGPRYIVPGATEYKYMDVNFAKAGPTNKNWEVPSNINLKEFDFSWHPHPDDPTFIYEFGTQWHDRGGPRYIGVGANKDTPIKYIDTRILKATLGPNNDNWYIPSGIEIQNFDYSWVPHPNDPPYIYRWGNKFVNNIFKPTVEYRVPGATETKYMSNDVEVLPEWNRWVIPDNIDRKTFDFSWRPDPLEPDYIWQFGTQWQETGGPRYIVPGASDIKYIDRTQIQSTSLSTRKNWEISAGIDVTNFDFSWHPDDRADPYIYQFGTLLDRNDGPKYVTPGNKGEVVYLPRVVTESNKFIEEETPPVLNTPEIHHEIEVGKYYIKTTLEDLISEHPNELFWALNPDIDYSNFDFNWRPSFDQAEYVHAFGSEHNINTQTYFVSGVMWYQGNRKINYVKCNIEFQYLINLFFVDRGNKESATRFEKLKEKFGDRIQKTRYLNSWVDTINRCINRSTSNLCWILNSELDYTNFNFDYYPNPWQMKMVHVFGTQWNHWGTTFMVNRETFSTDTKYIKVIEHLSNLNFVKDRVAMAESVVHDIVYIDHGNLDESKLAAINNEGKLVVKYYNDYLTTFKTILKQLPEKKEHYIWIVSSVCDYNKFDFTYVCDPYAKEQLHVFPSDQQKFGDTFFVNVNRLRELVNDMQSLKDYDKINYNQVLKANRLPAPTIVHEFDSHVLGIMQDFDFPYATFITEDNKDIVVVDQEPMCLWDQESKTITITSTGGTHITVPKEAKQYVDTQLYDYPYIKTASRLAKSNPLDIVYLSNGEKCAEENYEHLIKVTKGLPNRVVRVDGVNGRVQAYHAAAEASNTSWFLAVFAKLKVNAKFDFNWQPDRLQIPKHYMFLAKNPVNGLIYGHQGMIAYNKQMTLDNTGIGLDFTLDSPHDTVELLSGIATYNTDEFSTWRTAFREAIKLKKENSEISLKRLEAWLTKAEGEFAQYSLDGAKHGIEYYEEVNGKIKELKQSYEWNWLLKKFNQVNK